MRQQPRQLSWLIDNEYLPEFAGAFLEDSYFLGVVAEGGDLRLKCLFALTLDHVSYSPPEPGEQHCYREGGLLFEQPSIIEWQAGKPTIMRDPDGSLDFGGIALYRSGPNRFRLVTEWFDATVETKRVTVDLLDEKV